MKRKDLIPSRYLKQEDVDGEVVVTIRRVTQENVARDDQPQDLKWLLWFDEFDKPLVLNPTNSDRCFIALGEDTDDWIGRKMILFVDPEVRYAGKQTGGLRLKPLPGAGTNTRSGTPIAPKGGKLPDSVSFK